MKRESIIWFFPFFNKHGIRIVKKHSVKENIKNAKNYHKKFRPYRKYQS
jgi:hypothetical protein